MESTRSSHKRVDFLHSEQKDTTTKIKCYRMDNHLPWLRSCRVSVAEDIHNI